MEKWNKNDWQGKRKEQVNYSEKMAIIAGAAFAVLVLIALISKLF